MRKPPPTLRDVALRAGVSVGTASHVINGKGFVSDARRELVLRAAGEIGYRTNHLARSLKKRRTHVVGFCAPMLSSAYLSAVVEAVHAQSEALNQHVMQVLSGGNPQRERERVESLIDRQVDGIILLPSAAPGATLDLIAKSHIPAVIVDRIQEDDRFDLVLLDHETAMKEVVEHLVALGHQRLLFVIRHPGLVTTRLRIETLLAAAAAAGLPEPRIVVTTNEPEDLPRDLPLQLRGDSPATAIITSNSINTLWTLRALRAAQVRVPEDLSIVAFDEPVWGELVEPPLTVVRQPTDAIVSSAWKLLMRRIEDPDASRSKIILRHELVIRGSTAGFGAP